VLGRLVERGQIRVHASEAERTHTLARLAADQWLAGHSDFLMIADTREQVAALNGAIRDRLVTTGHVDDQRSVTTRAGERIGIGDRVTTRLNDRHWGLANRDTWTVTQLSDLHVVLQGRRGQVRSVPLGYAHRHLELGYATTAHGAQGETVHSAHMVLGEHTSAASAYVGMTRGRDHNTAHLVAVDLDDARRQWDETHARDRADLGPGVAGLRAAEDIERYGPNRTPRPAYPGQRRIRRTPQQVTTPHHEPLEPPRPTAGSQQQGPGIGL
jgi:hypothetical protein